MTGKGGDPGQLETGTEAWPAERCARLRQMWADGVSTAKIGLRLGVSKNAVVGRARRMRLAERPSPIRPAGSGAPRSRPKVTDSAAIARSVLPRIAASEWAPPPARRLVPAEVHAAGPPPEAAYLPPPAALMSQPGLPISGGCRWPMWLHVEPPTHVYCDLPRRDAVCSYCGAHAKLAFTKVEAEVE